LSRVLAGNLDGLGAMDQFETFLGNNAETTKRNTAAMKHLSSA
jgi:hypothetical protein